MATAEARRRTRWPKNRCYIHGGSVEASRFSCSSSSSSPPSSYLSTSPESDQKPDSAAKEPHNTISDYLSSYPNANPDVSAKRQWWLNTDPNSSRHRDFMSAQQVSSEDDFVLLGEEFSGRGDSRSVGSGKEARDIWFLDDHLMDLDSINSLVSSEETKKLASEFESQWVGSDKTEPWWRSSGKDDLASLVAQKSLEIENCDLPRPRIYRKQPSSCSRSLDRGDNILASSLDRSVETGLSSPKSAGPPNDSQQTLSRSGSDKSEEQKSKDELLRALCLSQKRAREAEEAAKKAHSEKERVITLIFRQASHLFTYKQWIHLLQLEKICLQNQPICELFPWAPRLPKKGRHKPRKKPRDDIGKCGLAFVLGLGLAGAGLLLGWTMGWLFPSP